MSHHHIYKKEAHSYSQAKPATILFNQGLLKLRLIIIVHHQVNRTQAKCVRKAKDKKKGFKSRANEAL